MVRQITVDLDQSSTLEGQSDGVKLVPRAGVEPARPFGQRILRPVMAAIGTVKWQKVRRRVKAFEIDLRSCGDVLYALSSHCVGCSINLCWTLHLNLISIELKLQS
jgi:hypothetical protein